MKMNEELAKAISPFRSKANPEECKDFADYLEEQFVNPIRKIGGEYQGISYSLMPKDSGGYWIMTFEIKEPDFKAEFMDNLMTDDDSQPYSQWGGFFGTYWILLPYFS
jgi:hypothetical protein